MTERNAVVRSATILAVASVSTVLWVLDRGPNVMMLPGPAGLWVLLVGVCTLALWPVSPKRHRRAVTTVLLGGVFSAQVVAALTEWVWVPCGVIGLALVAATVVYSEPDRLAAPVAQVGTWCERLFERLVGSFASEDSTDSCASSRAGRLLVAAAVAIGTVLALRDLRSVLYDDAAITLRYAWRIADGLGFTYNSGDRTNGASAPLYTLLLAATRVLGGDLVSAAKAIGVIAYATSLGLVAEIVGRVARTGAALLAVVVVVASVDFRLEVLSGMESGVAVVLGLGAILLVLERRDGLAGIVLGLAVFNKLDGVMLVAAVVGAIWLVQRRFPRRTVITATAVAVPWFVFSTAYFGSPIPYSATQKLTVVGDPASGHDPLWMLRTIQADGQAAVLLVGLAATVWFTFSARAPTHLRLAATASGFWLVTHLLAFSALDLGDPYPWYVTVLYPLVGITASLGIAAAIGWLRDSRRLEPVDAAVLGVCVLMLALVPMAPGLRSAALAVVEGHEPDPYEQFESTRREAGRYLAAHSDADDVVETCWGWVAYGVPTNPIRETCPLSTRSDVDEPSWAVSSTWMEADTSGLPDGELVIRFRSCGDPSGSTDVVRLGEAGVPNGAPGSRRSPPCLDGG